MWDPEAKSCPARGRPLAFGDRVVLYGGRERISCVQLERNQAVNHKFGLFRHNDMVGKSFGDRIYAERAASGSKGFVTMLRPTPELWRLGPINRRTQILYTRDISHVRFMLELSPGKTVLESGTGSGSFSMSLARAVAPHGRVRSFEFHEVRAQTARDMFGTLGLHTIIEVEHRDVCGTGFGVEPASADAVFLDLPSPETVIPYVKEALKPHSPMCSFSPCIEQVANTCNALRELGFTDISTVECLLATVDPQSRESAFDEEEFADIASGEKVPRKVRERIERRKSREREQSEAGSGENGEKKTKAEGEAGAKVETETAAGEAQECKDAHGSTAGHGVGQKRAREGDDADRGEASSEDADGPEGSASVPSSGFSFAAGRLSYTPGAVRSLVTRNVGEQRGHTSFLTFARRPPA